MDKIFSKNFDGRLSDIVKFDRYLHRHFLIPSFRGLEAEIYFQLKEFLDNLYLYCQEKKVYIAPEIDDIYYRREKGKCHFFIKESLDLLPFFSDVNPYGGCFGFLNFYDGKIELLCDSE